MYVKPQGPALADTMIVGEAPGKHEDETGLPFQGAAGSKLNAGLSVASINRVECWITNVAKERPPKNNIGHYFEDNKHTIPIPRMQEYIQSLKKEIQDNRPNIIIALGDTALWALTGLHGISKFRGYVTECTLVPGIKVLPTFHPANVCRVPTNFVPFCMDLKKAKFHSKFPWIPKEKAILDIDPSKDFFIDYCESLIKENNSIAVDIETTKNYINRIGISESINHVVTLGIFNGAYPKFPERDEIEIWQTLSRLLKKVPQIYHNAGYDVAVLWYSNHIRCNIYGDTMLAGHIMFPEQSKSLGFLASILLDVQAWKHTAKEDGPRYNALDALNTYRLHKWYEKHNAYNNIYQRELSWLPVAMKMQLQGLHVDIEKRDLLIKKFEKEIEDSHREIEKELGYDLNCNSPKQVQKCLYIDLGLPLMYKRRKSTSEPRKLTTDNEALEKLSEHSPIPALIIKERKARKRISSFLDITLSPDSRVHTCYNVTGTSLGGRWSSSKSIILPYGPGNLQNIPEAMRILYDVPKGYVLVEGDYIQAEAVVVAYDSQDIQLIKFFEEAFGMPPSERKISHDLHRFTAALMYQKRMDEITPEERKVGKRLRHAGNYGAGPGVVASQLGITRSQAKQLMKIYYNANPMLSRWQDNIRKQLTATRTLTNLYGRKHVFHGFIPKIFDEGFSYIPQTTVGEMLNDAMADFEEKYGTQYNVILQLHDAFYTLAPWELELDCIKAMRSCMITPLKVHGRTMTVDVDFSRSTSSWGEMESVDIDWRK